MNEPFDIQPMVGTSYRKQCMQPPVQTKSVAASLR